MIRKVVVFLLIFSLVLPVPLFAAVIGEFAVVSGDVTVTRAGKAIKPKVKDKVESRDLIQTGKNSNARVVLTDASAMALGPNTKLEMKQFDIQGKKTTGLFYVPTGLVQTNVAKALGPGSRFEMQTPNAIAGVRGTAWLTLVQIATNNILQSTVYGLQQAVAVANAALPAQAVTVVAGNFTVVAGATLPTAVAAFAPATVAGLTSTLGVSAIPGVAAGAAGAAGATGAAAGTTGAATGVGTAAGTATVAGVGTGTIAAGVVAAAAVVAAVAASTSKSDTTPTHTSTTTHHGTTTHH